MLKLETIKVIDVDKWNDFIVETYGKPYNFQQQDGCKERQYTNVDVKYYVGEWDINEELEELEEYGGDIPFVRLDEWLAKEVEKPSEGNEKWRIETRWERDFYPHIGELIIDLYNKNLIKLETFYINIDW